ncbi:hypothetical protein J6590_048602 [Homalodisca vitripennis]|nr:hypothetical protein J6590_048602 [Homalodisca vitripennis]
MARARWIHCLMKWFLLQATEAAETIANLTSTFQNFLQPPSRVKSAAAPQSCRGGARRTHFRLIAAVLYGDLLVSSRQETVPCRHCPSGVLPLLTPPHPRHPPGVGPTVITLGDWDSQGNLKNNCYSPPHHLCVRLGRHRGYWEILAIQSISVRVFCSRMSMCARNSMLSWKHVKTFRRGGGGVGSHRPQRKQRGRHQKKTLSAEGKIIRRSPRDGGKKASKVLGFDMNFNSEKTEVRGRSVNNRSQAEGQRRI